MSRESSGGAAAAGGVGNESRWLAWMLAFLLSDRPLPGWAGGRPIAAAGAQTERAADDLAAVTSDGAWITAQAKAVIKIAKDEASPLSEALTQVVETYIRPVPEHGGTTKRDVRPGHDRVLILGGPQSPGTVNDTLGPLMDRLRGWPSQVPLAEALKNQEQKNAFAVVRDHLTRAWKEAKNVDLAENDLRALLSLIGVRSLNLAEGQDLQDVRAILRDVAAEEDVDAVWRELQLVAQDIDEKQQVLNRTELLHRVESKVPLSPLARFRPTIDRLRELTERNLGAMREGVALAVPEGEVRLDRAVSGELTSIGGNLALIGDAGVGKTSVLVGHASNLRSSGHDVVVLRADDLLRGAREAINLTYPLQDVLAQWPSMLPGYLLVDGLDQVRSDDPSAWLAAVIEGLSGTRWRTVVTIRDFDLRTSKRWKQTFRGAAPDPTRCAPGLEHVRHVTIEDFADDEMEPLRDLSPTLAGLLSTAEPRLRRLLMNPFNLSLAASLLGTPDAPNLSQIAHRVQLLHLYWLDRVAQQGAVNSRIGVLGNVVRAMLAARSQSLDATTIEPVPVDDVLNGLLHDGVLRATAVRPGHPAPMIEFTHPVLYDYAVALLALGDTRDPRSLPTALDTNPDLVLIARPSIEYRLATIWHDQPDRTDFWNVALALSATHVLAAAIAAKQAAELVRSTDDMASLEGACAATAASGVGWGPEHARILLFLTARYIGLSAQADSLALLAGIIARLAQRAKMAGDLDLAYLCLQATIRVNPPESITAATTALSAWADATCESLAVAIADPIRSATTNVPYTGMRLLAAITPHLASATNPTVIESIDPAVIDQWGPDALFPLAAKFDVIARTSPHLAIAIARTVWQRDDSSEQLTPVLGHSRIFNLISNRRQDLDGVRHEIATRFGALLETESAEAIRLIIEVVNDPEPATGRSSTDFANPPRVRPGRTMLLSGGDNDRLRLTAALAACLGGESVTVEPLGRDVVSVRPLDDLLLAEAVEILISQLTNAEVWQKLLYAAAITANTRLATALTPALTSPNLYSVSTTWLLATYVARRIIASAAPEAQQEILAAVAALTTANRRATADPTAQARLQTQGATIREELTAAVEGRPSILPSTPDDPFEIFKMLTFGEPALPEAGTVEHLEQQIREGDQLLSSADETENEAGQAQLLQLWAELQQHPQPASVADQRVDLAQRITRLVAVTPGSAVGAQLYDVLKASIPAVSPPPIDDEDRSELDGYYPTTATNAAEGIYRLLSRPDWAAVHGPEMRDLLRPLISFEDSSLRFIAARALNLIFPDAAELVSAIEERLRAETWRPARATLLHQLWQTRFSDAARIDAVLSRLVDTGGWQFLTAATDDEVDPRGNEREVAVGIVGLLACFYRTPFAAERCAAWLSAPQAYPHSSDAVVRVLRDLLNPADETLLPAQTEAFRLLGVATQAAISNLAAIPVSESADVRSVLAEIATQIYFASGASDQLLNRNHQRGPIDRFAGLALPVLTKLAAVDDVRLAHHVVRTIDHLRGTDTGSVINILGIVVSANPDYAFEYEGMDNVRTLINDLITEHGPAVMGHPQGLSTIRRVLEKFVQTGWDPAMDLYDSLTDLRMQPIT